jgi:hypothetical protein
MCDQLSKDFFINFNSWNPEDEASWSEDQPFVEVVKASAGAGLSHVDEDVLDRLFVL